MGLNYSNDGTPGITRRMLRGKWAYFAPDGERVRDDDEIDRLNRLALPPAYTDAWYSPDPDAHLQATGIDARGRKQYRYHTGFRAEREAYKFDGCVEFAEALPKIRERVTLDLGQRGVSRERALASIVRLLDTGGIRVGNESYAKENKTFGATTLRMRHANVKGDTIHLAFRAKSGKQCQLKVTDRGLARFVKKMQDLPGQNLFQYIDEDGTPTPITSTDVNAYVRETMGGAFTAKNFRTWAATAIAFETIHEAAAPIGKQELLLTVSSQLGNTPAVARKSYIHPAVLAALDAQEKLRAVKLPRATQWLSRHERALMTFLDAQPAAIKLVAA
jgi:DNA topoisomerase-1